MSESTYQVQGSRVYGNGESYNVTNRITAENLCKTLNCYEKTSKEYKEITEKLDKLNKQVIQIQLSLGILTDDINTLKETLE